MTTVSMLLGNVSSGYAVNNSLRFRSSASAYLNRTPATTTNQKTFTLSCWFKGLPSSSANYQIFSTLTTTGPNVGSYITFASGNLAIVNYVGGALDTALITNAVYRDPSAWYHIVFAVDTTQSTSSNRVKIYVNGVQITSFSTSTYSTLNSNFNFNSNVAHIIGAINANSSISQYIDGYFAEFNWIDGQALTASSFGTYDTNGVWQPINYSGSYGTNGFHLTFGNTTSTTTLGYDTSGNSNNWTTNNISLTAGTTYDSMLDSPTSVSTSVTNYAVLNPLYIEGTPTFSNANLSVSLPGAGGGTYPASAGTIAVTSGKWYWEVYPTSLTSNALVIGVTQSTAQMSAMDPFLYVGSAGYYGVNGNKLVAAVSTAYGATFTNGDVIGVALDVGGGTITFYKNNTSQGAITLPSGSNWIPVAANGASAGAQVFSINFGQQPFTYTPPTGFNALNTYNLPTPTIANGAQYMAATLYTGNGSSLAVNNGTNTTIGTTFQPDFVWIKSRSNAYDNQLFDAVRGTNSLASNSTAAEQAYGNFTSYNSNGFTANITGSISTNNNGSTFIGWQWKASGSTSSNTNGSITSTVSANTTAGFSVVTYTSQASGTGTIGHGLGVVPALIINKPRTGSVGWTVYHQSLGNNAYLVLNTTAAQVTGATTVWNSTDPTSSVFTQGSAFVGLGTMVAYCWAAIPNYSAFGSYTGNGSADGPFVYTGFKPRFFLYKDASSSSNAWVIFDSSRDTYNIESNYLLPNSSAAEGSNGSVDFVANGFKVRFAGGSINTSGNTIVYAAFAENPFQSSRAR